MAQDRKAKPPAPWFRFNVEKWFAMTRNLNPVESVALLTTMAECHQRGEPFPEDLGRMAKRCRTTRPAMDKAVETLIAEGLIVRRDGGLWSDYIESEIAHREERAEQASQNVKKRWKKDEGNQGPPDTDVAKSIRVEESQKGDGENPPSPNPSPSSSTADVGLRSAVKSSRRAPSGAPPRRYRIQEDLSVKGVGRCTVISISGHRMRLRSFDGDYLTAATGDDGYILQDQITCDPDALDERETGTDAA